MIRKNIDNILKEIGEVLSSVDGDEVKDLVNSLTAANKIVVCGAGRVGMATRGFGMRLGHLGLDAHTLGDSTVPAIGKGDLFLVSSGSGETQTIYDLAQIAKNNEATLILVTGNPDSKIGLIADKIVQINAPSKTKVVDGFSSIQPMTTLNEQCLGIFFDAVVLKLMDKMGETHESMWKRHSNLE